MALEPIGNRVIIKPDEVETVSEGGILMPVSDDYERQEKAQCSTGEIIGFGPSAWLDPILGGTPPVEIGDRVIFAKYSGKYIVNPEDGKEYIVVNDDAIQVRVI